MDLSASSVPDELDFCQNLECALGQVNWEEAWVIHSMPGCLGHQNIAESEVHLPQRPGLGDPYEPGPTGGFPTSCSGRREISSIRPGFRNPVLVPELSVLFFCNHHDKGGHPVGELSDDYLPI